MKNVITWLLGILGVTWPIWLIILLVSCMWWSASTGIQDDPSKYKKMNDLQQKAKTEHLHEAYKGE